MSEAYDRITRADPTPKTGPVPRKTDRARVTYEVFRYNRFGKPCLICGLPKWGRLLCFSCAKPGRKKKE